MSTKDFYANLPAFRDFTDITDCQHFAPLPQDWHVIVTDIVASTQAVERGQYKEVNLLGACSIVVILNIAKTIDIPFIFGGDGASILIPSILLEESKQALLALQELARDEFQLEMRTGIVPAEVVLASGYEINVAKFGTGSVQ